jgi:hypothetical protein
MKLNLLSIAFVTLFVATISMSSQAAWTPTAGTYYQTNVTKVYSGIYTEGDAVVFWALAGTNGLPAGWYTFNLTGSEATRTMASLVMLAYSKTKKIEFSLTGRLIGGWYEVSQLSVGNY